MPTHGIDSEQPPWVHSTRIPTLRVPPAWSNAEPWRSRHTPGYPAPRHREAEDSNLSSRGRRPWRSIWARQQPGLLRSARNDGLGDCHAGRHCEERSDAAVAMTNPGFMAGRQFRLPESGSSPRPAIVAGLMRRADPARTTDSGIGGEATRVMKVRSLRLMQHIDKLC